MPDMPDFDPERPVERRTPVRPHLLLVQRIWPCTDALSGSERVRRWHIARIDGQRDPLTRATVATDYLTGVLRHMPPEDAATLADEYIDFVLDLIDSFEDDQDDDEDEDDQ